MMTIEELNGPIWPDELPVFTTDGSHNRHKYVWWGWNPWYPRWSQSCWGADTMDKASKLLLKPLAIKMRSYHNKLIHLENGVHTVIGDLPPNDDKEAWLSGFIAVKQTEGGKAK